MDVELHAVRAGGMRDYRAQQRGLSKFSKHTINSRRHSAGGNG